VLIKQFSFWKILLVSITTNILTHPLACLGAIVFHKYFWIYFIIAEILVWIAESSIIYLILRKLTFKKAMLVSFLANGVTALLSFVPFLLSLFL
jgi:hypothetical protein